MLPDFLYILICPAYDWYFCIVSVREGWLAALYRAPCSPAQRNAHTQRDDSSLRSTYRLSKNRKIETWKLKQIKWFTHPDNTITLSTSPLSRVGVKFDVIWERVQSWVSNQLLCNSARLHYLPKSTHRSTSLLLLQKSALKLAAYIWGAFKELNIARHKQLLISIIWILMILILEKPKQFDLNLNHNRFTPRMAFGCVPARFQPCMWLALSFFCHIDPETHFEFSMLLETIHSLIIIYYS